jgi:hypothetical protein
VCLLWHVVAQPSSHSLRPWTVWLLRSLGAGWPRERVMQVRVPPVARGGAALEPLTAPVDRVAAAEPGRRLAARASHAGACARGAGGERGCESDQEGLSGVGDGAHAAVSRRPPVPLSRMVARTERATRTPRKCGRCPWFEGHLRSPVPL